MADILEQIRENVIDGENKLVPSLVQKALDEGLDPTVILNDGLMEAMAEVGKLYEEGEFFVPEMLVSARAMTAGMDIIKPLLIKADVKPAGKIVIGTVEGDLHDIGKNIVCMMLEGAAFEVVDLGNDVSKDAFVEAVKREKPELVGMSAMLTTTMVQMKNVIDALKEAGVRDEVKVIIGGAPISDKYVTEIGANGFAKDANSAVAVAKSLTAK